MNWIDILIIIAAALGSLVGWRMGFLGAIFNVIGIVVGILVAPSLSQFIADWFAEQGASQTVATVLAYVVIVVGLFIAAQVAKTIVKKALTLVFLGWVDTVGSVLVGLLFGFILAGALVLGLARLSVDVLGVGGVGEVTGIRGSIQRGMVKSTLVPVFLEVTWAIPGDALGLLPSEFQTALDQLEQLREQSEV
ncbi:MAG: CvpA family protein [Chloroflexi bacterium]|nr:CvpA family protein [Chloroflexota bacterium]